MSRIMHGELLAECLAHSRQSINISYNYWRPSGGRDLLRIAEHLRLRAGVRPRTSVSQYRAFHCPTPLSICPRKRKAQREAGSVRRSGRTCPPPKPVYITRSPEGSSPGLGLVIESPL